MAYRRVKDPKEVVVIFKTHLRPKADEDAYRRVSRRMHELAATIPGFLSIKEFTAEDGEVIDLARFADETSLQKWKIEPEHLEAQRRGREEFYDRFWVQVCDVVREYEFRPSEIKAAKEGTRRSGT
jgi:heme-degrading monooxygenase HmoA